LEILIIYLNPFIFPNHHYRIPQIHHFGSLVTADQFEMPPNSGVCIGTKLTFGFEVLDHMKRSKVAELSIFSPLQPNLANKCDFALLHTQNDVFTEK
jgi:hypothetical protein